MEPILFIAAMTALNLAVMAVLDVSTGAKPRLARLGWVLVILFLPLIGAIIYYLRAGKQPKCSTPRQPPTSPLAGGNSNRRG